ncbi:MAG TPA: alpha-2-macroglobulin, partial [Campylobacterales bacterium]|nr:alpha-2-macroglobulin [Campylobacterales bacterium]
GLPQGRYRFTLYTTDKYGTEVKKTKRNIVIYNLKEKNPPIKIDLWQRFDKTSYKVGEKAKLILKSSTPNSWVRLELQRGDKVQEKWIEFNKLAQKIIEIKKQDRGDILYRITMVKNNRIYQYQDKILVPWDDKLKVEFISFRDKLKPNSKEQWHIKISGENREKVLAQMVATMYDASLDKFVKHSFYKPNIFPYQNYLYDRWNAKSFGTVQGYAQWHNYITEYDRVFYHIRNEYNINDMTGMGGDIEHVMIMAPTPNINRGVEALQAMMSDPYSPPKIETNQKQPIHIRTNLQETMFFKPNLQTDKDGNIIINFKTNDALTRWNFLGFVHTKALQSAVIKKVITTQKELMVVTNLPRFFREGDKIKLTEKIVNLSNRDLKGECELKLKNPINRWNIYGNHKFIKPFHIKKGGSTTVTFYIHIPTIDSVPAIEHTVIARTKTHTDAEQIVKPILTNREFVTESKTLWLRGDESKTFTLQSLKDNNSTTLKNHKLTLEFTSNPIWYAIKSMPYLMEYPHECNEQLFSRYFANSLASNIINKHPKIKKVFESWRAKGSLKSQLSTNQELKSVMLEETPWLITAQSEEQQQKNIALLFDLDKLATKQKETLNRLFQNQNSDGGWSWFSGGKSNWYITQYILEGFGKLNSLGIGHKELTKSINYIDNQMLKRYKKLQKDIEKGYSKLEDDHLSNIIIHYLYTRNFYNQKMNNSIQQAYNYYLNQAKKYALTKGLYQQALLAITLNKTQNIKEAQDIILSLKDNAIENSEQGMYFKYHRGYYWYQAPIETQATMIEAFDQVAHDKKSVEELKVWLLKNKQTTHWKTTKATLNAIYALLINNNWLDNNKLVDISFDTKMDYKQIIEKAKKEAEKGTGYFKATFNKFSKTMATIKVTNPNSNIAWGGLYWQYFEDMDKIKSFKETPLTIYKRLYIYDTLERNQLIPITDQTLKVGDKIKSRIEIRVDRDMEFVMLKDGRASAFEPINVLSQYKWQDGLGYYESTKDNATYFFFDYLPKGTYVFEYPLIVTHHGEFSSGIATIESMYAPEFRSHSEGVRV